MFVNAVFRILRTSFQKILLREHFMVSYGLSVLRYGMRRLAVRDCSARMQYRFRSTACCGMIGSPCSKFSLERMYSRGSAG